MSVFNRVRINKFDPTRPCRGGHTWNGVRPEVDPDVHEYQNVELADKVCDCGRVRYGEKLCGCSHEQWKITMLAV